MTSITGASLQFREAKSRNGPFRVGIGGPVGSGKTALVEVLCKRLRNYYDIYVITNDIYTKEDQLILTRAEALPAERIMGVETGGCPHTAIREDASMNLAAIGDMNQRFHRRLQMPEYQTYINAALYLQQLCLSISRSRLEPNNIRLILAVRPLSIPSDRCWRLGMIVYELITNSARHAFQGTEGKVLVQLHSAGNFVECRVSDNGRSPPQIQRGRGLAIIHELAEHLDGRLEQTFGIEGSSSLLIFPS